MMHKIVQANIDRYESLLKSESDPTKRTMIARLLEEEKVKQKAITEAKAKIQR
ncbi:MAG: hypothetical protein WAW96_04775 [Alphaproteobacteria bacterium]